VSRAGILERAVAVVMVVAGLVCVPSAPAKGAPEADLSRIAEKVLPSVVALHVECSATIPAGLPVELEQFFAQQFRREPPPGLENFLRQYFRGGRGTRSLGSGVIVDEKGTVITNAHVVRGAVAVTAELHSGKRVAAKVLGADPRSDIAVVRLAGEGPFRPIEKAPRGQLRAGDRIVAVGSPLGFPGTVSAGVVSHPARYLPPAVDYMIREARAGGLYYGRLIQSDALVNRGSSGGALVDSKGRLVGIAVLLYRGDAARRFHPFPIPSDMLRGFAFAIPVAKIDRIAPLLAEGREIEYGYLGIAPNTLGATLAEAFGLGNRRGIVVNYVEDGSPASLAGLKVGEVIVSMDGTDLMCDGDLMEAVGAAGPGATASFEVASPGGRLRTVRAKLIRRKRPVPTRKREPPEEKKDEGLWRGMKFEEQGGEVRITLVKSDSPGARAGLSPRLRLNEVIIGGKRVKVESVEALLKMLDAADGPVAFRTDRSGYVAVPAE